MNYNKQIVRNSQVESLRGIAILLVLLFHVFCRFQQIFLNSNIVWMENFGSFGVSIFMFISCYYFVDFSKNNKSNSFSFIKYIKKKLKRLWPCYAVSITLTVVIVNFAVLPNRMSNWIDWILNLFFINGFIGTNYVDGAHWYLTVLISFIVLIGFAKKMNIEKSPFFYILIVLICFIVGKLNIPFLSAFLNINYIGYMCIAISIKAIIFIQSKNNKNFFQWVVVFFLGIACIIKYLGIIIGLELICVIPLFIGAIFKKFSFIENNLFLFLGKISYPLYLIHQNIAFEIEYYLTSFFGNYSYYYGIIAIILVIFIAIILYHLFENNLKIKEGLVLWGNLK